VPVTGATVATLIVVEALQPPGIVYTIVVVPVETALTIPEAASITATEGVLLVHVPPVTELLSASVEPRHSVAEPVIAEGMALTVTTAVATLPNRL
jgi:hypothetical protein